MKTTLQDFWNEHDVKSVFVASIGNPLGTTYTHNVGLDVSDEDYCDLYEVLLDGLFNRDDHGDSFAWSLTGEIDAGGDWEWDGNGNPTDQNGNSYTRIVLEV